MKTYTEFKSLIKEISNSAFWDTQFESSENVAAMKLKQKLQNVSVDKADVVTETGGVVFSIKNNPTKNWEFKISDGETLGKAPKALKPIIDKILKKNNIKNKIRYQ